MRGRKVGARQPASSGTRLLHPLPQEAGHDPVRREDPASRSAIAIPARVSHARHRVSLATARRLVLRFTPRYRLAEPIRAAHAEVNRLRLDSGDVRHE